MLVKTETENYIVIPRLERLNAIKMLEDANIECHSFNYETAPDDLLLKCTFKGREFTLNNVSVIKAAVEPESLMSALDENCKLPDLSKK